MIDDQVHAGSAPAETFRAALPGRTPEGERSTLIVTRQGVGRDGRVWLTFNGAIKTTVGDACRERKHAVDYADQKGVAGQVVGRSIRLCARGTRTDFL